jgi:hypothetical protein
LTSGCRTTSTEVGEHGRARWTEIEQEWADLVGRDQLDLVRAALETYLAADLATRDDQPPIGASMRC